MRGIAIYHSGLRGTLALPRETKKKMTTTRLIPESITLPLEVSHTYFKKGSLGDLNLGHRAVELLAR